jgi:hypothetical protein
MVANQVPSQRPPIAEPEVVGIDDLPVLYPYPPLHSWTLRGLVFPTVVRCVACGGMDHSVLVASNATSGAVACAACCDVSTATAPAATVVGVLGG